MGMIAEKVKQYLCSRGFVPGVVRADDDDFDLFIKRDEAARFSLIYIIDRSPGDEYFGEHLKEMDEIFKENFYNQRATKVDSLFIILSDDPEFEKGYAPEHNYENNELTYWLVDKTNKRLMVYENQPDDFCGIYKGVENAVCDNPLNNNENAVFDGQSDSNVKTRKPGGAVVPVPIVRVPYVTSLILALNVAYFVFLEIAGSTLDTGFMRQWGAMDPGLVLRDGQYYRVVTSMFMHFGFEHLINNMFMLLILGAILEQIIKPVPFAIMYLTNGFIAGIVSCAAMINTGETGTVVAGASGAVYGLLGIYIMSIIIAVFRIPKKERANFLKSFLPKTFIIILILATEGLYNPHVDVVAHMVGLVSGLVLGKLWFSFGSKR